MILTVFKSEVPHQQPKEISYRNYTRFDKQKFGTNANAILTQKILSKGFELPNLV